MSIIAIFVTDEVQLITKQQAPGITLCVKFVCTRLMVLSHFIMVFELRYLAVSREM